MPQAESNPCAEQPVTSAGVYLYCFARRTVSGRIQVPGIEEHSAATTLTVGEIAAVFSEVPLDSFNGPGGEAHLRDASWIVPRARRHEQVVEEVMRVSPVLPARFGLQVLQLDVLPEAHLARVVLDVALELLGQ